MKLMLLRQIGTKRWKTMTGEPFKFDARKFPGYRYYKSFPNTANGKEEAKEYARKAEADEKSISLR